jgi:aspartate/methionine/tyrosine aminotransferase
MYPAPRYLEWARRFYGQVPYDLASSGTPAVTRAELGDAPTLDDPHGHGSLLGAIARYNVVPEDEVVPALGTTHELWLAYAAVLSPADEVLVETPAYEPLWRTAAGVGARIARFTRRPEDGFAIDPDRVARAMTPHTRMVAITHLHNPTGVATSDDLLRELARLTAERGALLLVDEVYAAFDALVGDDAVWGKSARRLGANVVAVSSLTKCYGLGDYRIGWVLAPPQVAAAARGALLSSVGHLPLAHANLGAHAFAKLPALAARSRAQLGGKRATVERWVAGHANLRWSAPREGLFGFAWTNGGADLTSRIEAAALQSGCLVAPGAFFDQPEGFRLAWSIPEAKLEEGLTRLDRLLGHLNR